MSTNRVSDLLTGLQALLETVTLSDGSTPFNRVKIAADLETNYLTKVPDTQALSQEDRNFDGENPELGTQRVNIDLFTRDITQKAGNKQIVSETALQSCEEEIRNQIGHLAGGLFGAGCTLVQMQPPKREDVSNKVFLFRVRLTYEIIWG